MLGGTAVGVVALAVLWLGFGAVQGHRWSGTAFSSPLPAPPLDGLTVDDGQPVDLAAFRGDAVVIYFGYTNCPDVCPLTLWNTAKAVDSLGSRGDDVRVFMVSVDPARDSLAHVGEFVRHFDERFRGIGGPAEAIADAAALYGIFYEALEPDADGFYEVDHTSSLIGIDSDGRLRVVWGPEVTPDQLEADLRELLA